MNKGGANQILTLVIYIFEKSNVGNRAEQISTKDRASVVIHRRQRLLVSRDTLTQNGE